MAKGSDISLPDVSKLNDLKDDQIEALIEKLAEVQAHAPQIIAALEEQKEARSRGSKSVSSKDRLVNERQQAPPAQPQRRPLHEEQAEQVITEEEGEVDDEIGDDADYPMVGDGYSDEFSVMSDMTTPTVVSTMDVHEEELYHDMVIGGVKVNAPKKKDLLSQVARTNRQQKAAAPKAPMRSDVALKKPTRAPSKYNNTGNNNTNSPPNSTTSPSPRKKTGKAIKVAPGAAPAKKTTAKKKGPKKSVSANNLSTGSAGFDDWNNSFDYSKKNSKSTKKGALKEEKKSEPVMIDDDGFLVNQGDFSDAFDSNPFGEFSLTSSNQAVIPELESADVFGDVPGFADFKEFTPLEEKSKSKPKLKRLHEVGKSKSSKSTGSAKSSKSSGKSPKSPKSPRPVSPKRKGGSVNRRSSAV